MIEALYFTAAPRSSTQLPQGQSLRPARCQARAGRSAGRRGVIHFLFALKTLKFRSSSRKLLSRFDRPSPSRAARHHLESKTESPDPITAATDSRFIQCKLARLCALVSPCPASSARTFQPADVRISVPRAGYRTSSILADEGSGSLPAATSSSAGLASSRFQKTFSERHSLNAPAFTGGSVSFA